MASVTVAELAQKVGGTVVGDGARLISSCNTLMDAAADQVSLLHIAKYAGELETTRAGCVILAPGATALAKRAAGLPPLTAIEVKDIYPAWQKAMVLLHGHRKHADVGISPLAVIHPTATLGKNVSIHPYAVVGENCIIGDDVHLFPHVTLMTGAQIGNSTVLYPGVTVYEHSVIGSRCLINAGSVIGSDGFAYAQEGGRHDKMPQTGIVILEDDVEVGCASIIERGALKPTLVERGSKIGGHVIIGHNCRIGPGNLIISATCISGSTSTGKYVVMAGQVGVAGHLDIPDFVKIGAQSGVMANPEPNTDIVGSPALEASVAKRVFLQTLRLPELAKRVKELEKLVEKLTPKVQD